MAETFTAARCGQNITYTKLFTFYNEALNEHFVVYTDKSEDEKGNLNVFVSTFNPDDEKPDLLPLKSEEEWATAQRALADYSEELAKALEEAAQDEEIVLEIEEEAKPLIIRNGDENYTVLAAFQNTENGNEYVIYVTDEEKDKEDAEVLVGRVTEKDDSGLPVKIGPIEDMEEWDEIQDAVENLIDHINEG